MNLGVLIDTNGLKITYLPTLDHSSVAVNFTFSNSTGQPMTNLVFQLAAPKNVQMKLGPLSALHILPNQPTTQSVVFDNPSGVPLKFRYRISFTHQNQPVVLQGESQNL
jgi:hypothetical protein